MPTRIVKLEVVELSAESRTLLFAVADELRRGVNWWWRNWEAWHTERDSSALLIAEIEADRAWKAADKATRGERPKLAVAPLPNELNRKLGTGAAARCPSVNSRVITLVVNKLGKTLRTKQSTAAACKWWRAILLDLDSRGTARHAQSIPLDGANCKIKPCDERGRVAIEFRADRVAKAGEVVAREPFAESESKTGVCRGRAGSTLIAAKLKTDGKRAHYAKPAHEIAAGQRPLKQATITWDARARKWFVALTYEADAAAAANIDPDRVAVLRPGRRKCWRLRLPGGRSLVLGGRPNHVRHVRQSLLMQRWGRQHGYTFAPSRKGSGRERVLAPLFKLTARWNNFTRSCNDAVTAQLISVLADEGCGKLVLVTGDGTRALATAGKVEGREDSTGWPWYQFEQICQQKCNRVGIGVEVRTNLSARKGRKSSSDKAMGATG